MTTYIPVLADIVAVTVMVFALFLPRHGRRELVVAYLVVNVGVMAIAMTMASSNVGAGLGLGIFGVLSIIRLRSEELTQREIAYYFAALALGLLGGLAPSTVWITPALMAGLLVVLWVGDHPQLVGRSAQQEVVLDRAIADPSELRAHLTTVLGVEPTGFTVRRTDLVNDTTIVQVRYVPSSSPVSSVSAPADAAPLHRLPARAVR